MKLVTNLLAISRRDDPIAPIRDHTVVTTTFETVLQAATVALALLDLSTKFDGGLSPAAQCSSGWGGPGPFLVFTQKAPERSATQPAIRSPNKRSEPTYRSHVHRAAGPQ